MTRLGLAARIAVLAAVFVLAAPVQALALRFGSRAAQVIPMRFHRLFLCLFGIRVLVHGTPPQAGVPTLVLANHVSWLDIPVLSAGLPLSFIAKREIAHWPIFGLCARLQRCIFLDRTRKSATAAVNATVASRLAQGDAIVLFPEGTTGDGNRLLPFKSSIVGSARDVVRSSGLDEIELQPVAISYARRHGLPVTRREKPDIAWYGDMELPPHFRAFASRGPLDVLVHWGEPIPFGPTTDRKRATLLAEQMVRGALRASGTAPSGGGVNGSVQPYSNRGAESL